MSGVQVEVPQLVRERAFAGGGVGRRWLSELGEVVAELQRVWELELGVVYRGGTAGYVVAGRDRSGRDVVLKVAMPLDDEEVAGFARSVAVHRLADGRGCARLLAHDDTRSAMLLERLGPNLDELGPPLEDLLKVVATTLRSFWRPVDHQVSLPTGAEKAAWLAALIVATWEQLGRPCPRAVVDRAVGYCDERAAAFDWERSVLVHGDAHGWNTVSSGDGGYKFVQKASGRNRNKIWVCRCASTTSPCSRGTLLASFVSEPTRWRPGAMSTPRRSGSGGTSSECPPGS